MKATTINRIRSAILAAPALVLLLIWYGTCSARVLKSPGKTLESAERTLTLGSGVDFQFDSDEREYDFSFLIEYGLSEYLRVAAEPNYIHLSQSGASTVSGLGELEVSVGYDFLAPEDDNPGISGVGLVKLPTASNSKLGTGKADFTIGAGVNQEFENADADLSVMYTFVGSPPGARLQNSIELILAGEWSMNVVWSLIGELAAIDGAGRSHAQSGSVQGLTGRDGGSERSVTLGLSQALGESVKLEEGIVYVLDGTVQAVIAWEWTIGNR